jgi:hypothetical protein
MNHVKNLDAVRDWPIIRHVISANMPSAVAKSASLNALTHFRLRCEQTEQRFHFVEPSNRSG